MGKGKSPRQAGGPYLLDRLLVPRIQQLASQTDITDIDEVVEQLRSNHKEYQRKQVAALRQMVAKAVRVLQQQQGVHRREARLQAAEAAHLARHQTSSSQPANNADSASGDSDADGDKASDSADGDSDDEGPSSFVSAEGGQLTNGRASAEGGQGTNGRVSASQGPDADEDSDSDAADDVGATAPDRPNLNQQLLSMYKPPAAGAPQPQQQQGQQQGQGSASSSQQRASKPPSHNRSRGRGRDSSSSSSSSDDDEPVDPNAPPAFAPPHLIAAAAARAAAEERAARAAGGGRAAAAVSQMNGKGPGSCTHQHQQHQQQQQQTGTDDQPGPSGRQAATSLGLDQRVTPAAQPAAAPAPAAPAGTQQEAAADSKRTRTAEEAGLQRDTRGVPKKQRRAGGAAGGGGAAAGGGGGGGGSRRGGSAVSQPRAVTYQDLGGIEEVLAEIQELIEYPLKHPEVYSWLGVEPPRGVLLHGPPGCGKTALANAIANECGVPFLRVSAPEVVSGMSGESEAKLRALFQEAQDVAPAIIFIDEIDAIAPKRETAQREMERRIVAQMLTCMDDLAAPAGQPSVDQGVDQAGGQQGLAPQQQQQQQQQQRRPGHVVVVGATNRPDALDPALRRAGRFDREISLGIPTEAAREQILRVLTRPLRLQGDFDFKAVARRTPGFVGADLAALAKEAAAAAVTRIFKHLDATAAALPLPAPPAAAAAAGVVAEVQPGQGQSQRRFGGGPLTSAELAGLAISMGDWEVALPKVQPSVRREGFTTKPDVTWEDVGSLEEVREELSFCISQPIAHPEQFSAMGLTAAAGVLLYGPPGCGKTLVAKAAAAESGANFISIKGPELLNKYVGESERAVRQLFARARAAHPCVLFFDEMDALAPRRAGDSSNQAAERLVNQLLTEMDGVDGRQGVYMVAATNRPDMIDPALLRPGRLDKMLYVPLPSPEGRASILRAAARKTPMGEGVQQGAAALVASGRAEGYSGADVAALVREASVLALKEVLVATAGAAAGPGAAAAGAVAGTPAAAGAVAGVPGGPAAAAAAAGVAAAGAGTSASTAATSSSSSGSGVPGPALEVQLRHFEAALSRVQPSVSRKDQRLYDQMQRRLRSARGHISAEPGPPGGQDDAAAAAGDAVPAAAVPAAAAAAGLSAVPGQLPLLPPTLLPPPTAAVPVPAAAAAAPLINPAGMSGVGQGGVVGVGAMGGVASEAMGSLGEEMEGLEEEEVGGDPMADD